MKHVLTVVLEPEEGGGYSIHCPALPGCSSQGDTIDAALVNITEAIVGVLKARQGMDLPPPAETPETVSDEIRRILADRAEDGLPLTIETRVVRLPEAVTA